MKTLEELRSALGNFYLKRYDNCYKDCYERLKSLEITDTSIEDDKFVIRLRRPGLLIGPKGRNIFALQEYLKCKVKIIEETDPDPYRHIMPYDVDDEIY